ncbi:phytanoyl-CoA dioxygenase family protein [Marivibrio halodurans]|uniref:Phytanoyl-CoA dioxygenase family protein n=1 Tax=Marivibrio halodurans TaxID=2039722 RepID=A0A8J7S6U7_9PROT|nr:phytanoyl-CoA dioxygenase family protein [Marivibrio halodurans]MBP5857874.1 phytanoyl-CoA dioxygenase family protein [Marivibrio halodurans]
MIDDTLIDAYQRDGAVVVRGAFAAHVETIAAGIARNMAEPGPYAAENLKPGEAGRFFDDYCNWQRLPEIRRIVEDSPAAEIAAAAMRSRSAQFFHDHILVKEPGTAKATPWHQDMPYYFVAGHQTLSMWIPVDPVTEDTCPQFIAGSHRWEKMVTPVRWLDDSDFYPDPSLYRPVPDPSVENFDILSWALEPGDAILFDFRTAHGAPGNLTAARRRALSLRWVGDDARYAERPGRTSPPFPGHGMIPGQRLRQDWFPVLFGNG